ncbi:hypothetical protein VaNZ11_013053 [Volvox africanus]|uniref:Protein kinase domain-containing protein n=1 Tax=Volvox africanus TaxID=51714 RepID=A0ABQ5SF76_9CHLO|nr:hypothetical protein VaNZ11_013053 [Volvox africanus]
MVCDPVVAHGYRQLQVKEALQAMGEAVRSGDILKARGIGGQCVVPLNLTASDLNISGKLSEGAESTVFRGHWNGQEVAVKKVRIAVSADLDRFRGELDLLSSLHHPAVVPLIGARALPPDYMIVLPLAAGGNVRHALYDRGWRPSWRQLLGLAFSVAAGMEYVHAAGILHRDLKPANLLLLDLPNQATLYKTGEGDCSEAGSGGRSGGGSGGSTATADVAMEDDAGAEHVAGAANPSCGNLGVLPGGIEPLRVQLADFGIAIRVGGPGGGGGVAAAAGESQEASVLAGAKSGKPSGGFYKRMMVGTLEYMAPELLLRTSPASPASDVYAWAVTVNEVAAGVVPFSDCIKDNPEVHTVLELGYGRMELAAAVSAEGLRPQLPHTSPPGFAALMQWCWRSEPAERPTFSQVLGALKELAEEVVRWEPYQQQQQQQQQQHESSSLAEVAAAGEKVGGQMPVLVSVTAVDGGEYDASDGSGCHGPDGGCDGSAPATAMDVCDEEKHIQCSAAAATKSPVAAWPPQSVLPPFVLCSDEDDTTSNGPSNGYVSPNGNDHADNGHSAVRGGGASLAAALQEERVATSSSSSSPAAAAAATVRAGVEPIFNAGMFEAIGPRDSMEDRCVLLPNVPAVAAAVAAGGGGDSSSPDLTVRVPTAAHHRWITLPLVALFDGHRGADAAEFCRTRLPEMLWAEAQQCTSPAVALRRTFQRLETEYHEHWRQQNLLRCRGGGGGGGPSFFSGTTALAALLAPGGRLFVANAGDCRAVVCRGRRAMAASRDHTGLLVDERQRLTACGTAMMWQHGGWRVGTSGLQVTRCIGDFDIKNGAASTTAMTGVTALPEITSLELQPDDHFIVLGTDGLWDVVSAQEAVGLVYDTVKDPTLAAKRLVTEALMRGSADNVSVVVVFLSRVATMERVYGAAEGEAFAITGTAYGSRVRLTRDRNIIASADEVHDTY